VKNIILLGILLLSMVFARRDCLQHAPIDILGRTMRPDKDTLAISPSGHFYIHFDTTGSAAPDLTDSDGNGIPDYVDEVGIIADSAYYVLVGQMGYSEEPFDGEGGYDIYIMSYGVGVYGYNYKDNGNTSYLQIDNDYVGYNSKFDLTPIQIMRISVAHEYFHGIQWGYEKNLGINAYFYEMTSMWFEDVLVPDGNDYLDGWADDLLNNPTADFDNTGGGYELALFGHYLSSFIDEKGIDDVKQSTIIREIWEDYSSRCINTDNQCSNIIESNQCETSENCDWIRGSCTIDTDTCIDYNKNSCEACIKDNDFGEQDSEPDCLSVCIVEDVALPGSCVGPICCNYQETVNIAGEETTVNYCGNGICDDNRDCEWIDGEIIVFNSVKSTIKNRYNQPFIKYWVDFMSRNLYNGIYEDMDNDFYYYSDQTLIEPILTITPTINDSISFNFDLDNKSVSIQSYSMGDLNTIVEIKHVLGDYIGRVATVSRESNVNTMFWSKDTLSQELYPDDEIHFIYGIDQSSGRIFIDAIPHTVPIPPSGLIATSAQDSMILYWNPSPGPGDSLYYVIYRDGDSIFQTIDTNYTDLHGISGEIDYSYEVTCYNENGESQPSGIVSITSWPTENNVTENQILSIYPNPIHKTNDTYILYALGTNYSKINLELINIRGQIVKTILLQSDQQGWHRENIHHVLNNNPSSGIYFIRLQHAKVSGQAVKITILN